jgi:hypothetical protein
MPVTFTRPNVVSRSSKMMQAWYRTLSWRQAAMNYQTDAFVRFRLDPVSCTSLDKPHPQASVQSIYQDRKFDTIFGFII